MVNLLNEIQIPTAILDGVRNLYAIKGGLGLRLNSRPVLLNYMNGAGRRRGHQVTRVEALRWEL